MTDTMIDWVNSWFYNPGSLQEPSSDRLWCFLSAVVLIEKYRRPSDLSSKQLQRNLHDILVYTLLGWNPVTAWIKKSLYDKPICKPTEIIPYRILIKQSLSNLLDFTKKPSVCDKYKLVANALKTFDKTGADNRSCFIGEYVTDLMLALWLVDRTYEMPTKNLSLIRGCLDLYYNSKKHEVVDEKYEYALSSSDMHYCQWLSKWCKSIVTSDVSNDVMFSQISYLGWFVSLVRAERVIKVHDRNSEWTQSITKLLDSEIVRMKQLLADAELKITQQRSRSLSLCGAKLLSLFRIKPQKVKIKITSKEK